MTVSNGMEAIMTGIALRRNVLPSQRVGELHSAVIVDAVFGIAARCGLHSLQVVDPLARQSDCDIARTALALEHLHSKAALRHQLITPIPIQSASRPHPASQSENCESVRHEWLLAWTRRRQPRPSSAPSAWNSALTGPPSIRPASLPSLDAPRRLGTCPGCLRPVPRARARPKPRSGVR